MTLLLREVTALVAGAALWLGLVALLAVVPPFAGGLMRRRRPTGHELRWAVAAGLVAAGVLTRLGIEDPFGILVVRRPLPLLWVLVGAAVGTALAAPRARRRGRSAVVRQDER